MTKKGFTLVELLATIVIIAFIMGIVLPSATRVSKENNEELCLAYKKMMVEYAETSPKSKHIYIELSDLDELSKIKDDCNDGYVTVDYDDNGIPIYEAHLDCPSVCSTDEDFIPASDERRTSNNMPACKTDLVYNGEYQDLVNRNDQVYSLINEKRVNIGKQNVTAILKDKNTYAWSDLNQDTIVIRDCEIKKRNVTLVAIDKEFTYLSSPQAFTYRVDNTIRINGVEENPLASKVKYRVVDLNGTPLADKYLVKNSNGDIINVTNETPAGTYLIIPSSTVTNNYNLVIGKGKLIVNPKPVTVTAASASKTYDKQELTNSNCSMSETLSGYTISCAMTSDSRITNVGNVNNTIGTVTIKRSAEDVTNNFAVTKNPGLLKITQAPGYVNISSNSGSVNCNGKNTFTVSSHHGGTLSCTSSNTSVATCSISGTTVTFNGIGQGSANLTIRSSDTQNYSAATKTYAATTGACTITCSSGTYLQANSGSCSTCPANSWCGGGTYNTYVSYEQGRNACLSGYSSPAGSSSKGKCCNGSVCE